jgi:methylenetetrahydromethanopterin dehydrogenase
MPEKMFNLAVIKLGCIGAAPLLDLIVDERADREDLVVRAFTSGAKLDADSCQGPVADALNFQPDLVLLVSPNAALPGPAQSRQRLTGAGIPVIIIGDGPSRRAFYNKDDSGKQVLNIQPGQGFIILPCDPMLGARREFLDPSEMVLFNSDIIKLLAATGVIRCIQNEIDRVVNQLKTAAPAELPTLTVTPETALAAARFGNPYAAAKAYAALKIAESVAAVTTTACFVEQDAARYVPMVAAAHEMMRSAAQLADEAREIEKYNDSVVRTPHSAAGLTGSKLRLGEKLS